MDWIFNYLNKPWISGGYGPDSYDCWGLVWAVYTQQYDIPLPRFPEVDAKDHLRVSRELLKGKDHTSWETTSAPLSGDVVLMGQGKYPTHVGIYLENDGGVILHATDRGSVVITGVKNLQSQFYLKTMGYYRHREMKHD